MAQGQTMNMTFLFYLAAFLLLLGGGFYGLVAGSLGSFMPVVLILAVGLYSVVFLLLRRRRSDAQGPTTEGPPGWPPARP